MQENILWVVGASYYIIKGSLNFVVKSWWILVCHKLGLIFEAKILTLDRSALVPSIMDGNEINIYKILAREI